MPKRNTPLKIETRVEVRLGIGRRGDSATASKEEDIAEHTRIMTKSRCNDRTEKK